MRHSLSSLMDLCYGTNDEKNWLSHLEQTHWLSHLHYLISGSCRIVQVLQDEGLSVLVHCSDGWDRTSQLTALSQLMLDPFYRTIRGFAILVEKEWCSFGHMFHRRTGHGDKNYSDEQRSPIFLQWLDAVWQITIQFPSACEFNNKMLHFLARSLNSCEYGTFLYNCEQERVLAGVTTQTQSVWSHIVEQRSKYKNPLYKPCQTTLRPSSRVRSLRVWDYHLQYSLSQSKKISKDAVIAELCARLRKLEKQLEGNGRD